MAGQEDRVVSCAAVQLEKPGTSWEEIEIEPGGNRADSLYAPETFVGRIVDRRRSVKRTLRLFFFIRRAGRRGTLVFVRQDGSSRLR